MATETGFFKGPENTQIFYQCWLPQDDPKAVLIVVHGLAEHSGRYMNLVNCLVPNGYAVYGLDHYGHGKSQGKRLYVPEFNVFKRTLDQFVSQVKEWEDGKPVFLVGHSMGGLISSAYLLDHQEKVNGAILSGPGVKIPDHVTSVTRTAARVFSHLMPKLGITQLDAKDISRDPEVVKAYVNDPLVSVGKITARLASQMLDACDAVVRRSPELTLPLLLLHGGADALVDLEGSQQFHESISSRDKKLIVYEDKYHEIFNDPGFEQVFSDIEDWLSQHLTDPKKTRPVSAS